MKKKKVIILIIIILIAIFFFYFSLNENNEEMKNIEIVSEKEAVASKNTIISTLTAPAEVASSVEEKLSLNTSYYFLTMCVENEEVVKKGENILKYTNGKYLVAPYDCVVISYNVPTVKNKAEESHYVQIASLEDLYININISEDQIKSIEEGQEVSIIANYDKEKNYTGTVTKINEIGTRSTSGTNFAAIASVKNDGSLKLGMLVNSEVVISKDENLLTVPVESVIVEENERYVNKIMSDGSVIKTIVETGVSDANNVEIKTGLVEGDKIKYEVRTYEVVKSEENNNDNSKSLMDIIGGGNSNLKQRGGRN